MPRPYTAWWTRYGPERVATAEALLREYRGYLERRVDWHRRHCGPDVDWDAVVWEAAYHAAFACRCGSGRGFVTLFGQALRWQRAKALATLTRRARRLRRVDLTAGDDLGELIDARHWYLPPAPSDPLPTPHTPPPSADHA